jgi:hypothetical protein
MDPITLIVSALLAGALSGAQQTANDAIKDAYQGLKVLIQRKMTGKPEAEFIFSKFEEKMETWELPLKEMLIDITAEKDAEILIAAQRLLNLINPENGLSGKFHIDVDGGIQGLVQGDNANVRMQFGNEPNRKTKKDKHIK